MQLQRNEIMTGLLVIGTVAVLAFVLVLLGAPGLFRPLVTYKIYFDNAAGIKVGAPVMLAGRKIGQVQKLFSPVSREEDERAKNAEMFPGERVPDFGEAAAKMLEVIKPVAAEATSTMKDLQNTAQNLSRLTDENSELNLALGEFKTFGEHLVDLTAPDAALSHSLNNIEKISTELTDNNNIGVSLQNFRDSSERLKATMNDLDPAARNIKDFSETVKTQPWRLIWPTTKKYPEEQQQTASAARQTINVRKSTKAKPSATPTRRAASRE